MDFSAQDKQRLNDKMMVGIAKEYMRQMGYCNTQYIIARHHDTDHPHIHLVINRINNDGKRISDQNEKLRSTKFCLELTKKYGLYIASGKENVKRERLKGNDKTKYEIYDALRKSVPRCLTWEQLQQSLKQQGITMDFKMNGNTDKIQGIIFEKDGNRISGSKVDRACSFSKIDRQIKDNAYHALQEAERQEEKMSEGNGIINTIDSILGQLKIFSLLDSPHYDATLADYIQSLKARKLATKNRIRIRRRL
ncbi:relaxase/mobilization nuclease domain-containing protein [Porphyromonas pogonae]|uniref:relaxase/mobilization nuclease domain-containing protein n=1 Tax=Porphyromonas pogonae TaxID=867595 RepID=UPI002E766DD8|nr:relaxase/mobilization nuclease domain-containing protein [Porphyromonas pogonae]